MSLRPFFRLFSKQSLLSDLALIEFLLDSPYVENQVRVATSGIAVDIITNRPDVNFFKTMAATGRKFRITAGEIRFSPLKNKKIK